ncbi:hypothetical protein [Plantactinospora sp. CA-290183]|uniref:hypothetical protein n=1 Tax=Plantactinospora sp. CA-290183 TaxID=3240006 RepID=UPI003D91369D
MKTPADAAAARVSFQLTYARSLKRREFMPGELTGPDIPCAYDGEINASGDWNDSRDDTPATDDGGSEESGVAKTVFAGRDESGWIDRYANYAVNEAVHEALEWYRVDGHPWLDPHGPAEDEIYSAVNDLVDRLAAIRARHAPVVAHRL